MNLTRLIDLVRRSIREYEPVRNDSNNNSSLSNVFLDLSYNSSRWFPVNAHSWKEASVHSQYNGYMKYVRSQLQYIKNGIAKVNGVSVSV